MSFFSKLFKEESKDWFFDRIPEVQTPNDTPIKKVDKDDEYLSIILKSMRIENARIGFSKFYATVHSFITLSHASGIRASFYVSTTPGKLEELDKSNINKIILANKRLLGPVPYLGSDVNMEIGLFSMKSADLLKPFVSLLTDISNLASVSFVKVAEPYIRPLESGINLLLGTSNPTVLETGISRAFINFIETGYYVIMCVPKDQMKKENIIIDNQDFKLLDEKRNPIIKYPYMVIQITSDTRRDDWREIPDIKLPHERLKAAARETTNTYEKVKEALAVFRRTVQFSDDLIESHKKIIIKIVTDDITEKLGATLTSGGTIPEPKDLSEIDIYSNIP
jgi:hypothetical protein